MNLTLLHSQTVHTL